MAEYLCWEWVDGRFCCIELCGWEAVCLGSGWMRGYIVWESMDGRLVGSKIGG